MNFMMIIPIIFMIILLLFFILFLFLFIIKYNTLKTIYKDSNIKYDKNNKKEVKK